MSRKRHQARRKATPRPKSGIKAFGSKEWVMAALERKLRSAPEAPEERDIPLSEYLTYRKLHRILWPRTETVAALSWDEPDWMDGPRPPDSPDSPDRN